MKTLVTLLALSLSTLSFAWDAPQYLPEIRVVDAEIISGPTFPGGPGTQLLQVSFEAAACRTLSASDFSVEVIDNSLHIYQQFSVDCFGPSRRQIISISEWTDIELYEGLFIANPLLLNNRIFY